MFVNTLKGRSRVVASFSTPAPFDEGIIRSREEARRARWESIRYTVPTHAVHCAPDVEPMPTKQRLQAGSPAFVNPTDSHGRYGRKHNKRNRGNKRWEV